MEKQFEDVVLSNTARRSHLYSKLVVKVKLEILREEVTEDSWTELKKSSTGVTLNPDKVTIVDNLTIVTGEFNFKGFMKNYIKDLLNHYKIEIVKKDIAQCKE